MNRLSAATLLGTCVVAVGCSASEDAEASGPRIERRMVGDTTIVRTLAGSTWGDSVDVVEQVRIGVLDGEPEYQLGAVGAIAVDARRGIYVFDRLVPALRYYDSTGTYVRTVGGKGSGPGEYGDAALGLVVRRSDGRVVLRDARNMRLDVYDSTGASSATWRLASGLFAPHATVRDTADHLYLKILTGPPERNKAWPIALLHLDDRGEVVDTLVPPVLPDEPENPYGTFAVAKPWDYSPLGGFVAGVNDRYRIEHFRDDGTVLRIERNVTPAAVPAAERAEREAYTDWLQRMQRQSLAVDLPPVPDTKPFFQAIRVGDDGRIWVDRYMEARKGEEEQPRSFAGQEPPPPMSWHQPNVWDVFEADGTFLGSVTFPRSFTPDVMRGDRIWGVLTGALDEDYVVGYRLLHE
jgi:hypothetical protein